MKKAFLMVAISLLLCLLMVGCSVSATTEDVTHIDTVEPGAVVFADDVDVDMSESEAVASAESGTYSGTWGNLTWTLNESTGELVISGIGEMDDFLFDSTTVAWRHYSSFIKIVTIDNGVTSIGSCAFYGCTGLTNITIPDSVTSIGGSAFYGCTNLTNITIPDGVTSIGETVFTSCDNLTYNIYSNAKYLGNEDNPYLVLIKSTSKSIESCTVNEKCKIIAPFAFKYHSFLPSINIPDSVTAIGNNAFDECYSLDSVTFGEDSQLTTIGDEAFASCHDLQTIDIPDSVTTIGNYAFKWCDSLKSVTIGDSVTTIGDYAFEQVAGGGGTSLTIPASVTSIGANAFRNWNYLTDVYYLGTLEQWCGITFGSLWANPVSLAANLYIDGELIAGELVIPNTVTEIKTYAFSGCTNLTNITIPNSVTNIGSGAFYGCTGLTNITIPDSVTSIDNATFRDCSSLTNITIPASVTIIDGMLTFDRCFALKIIYIKSPIIATELTSDTACGDLIDNAEVILIEESITSVATYVTDNFSYKEKLNYEGTDYVSYSKHEHDWEDCSVNRIPCERDGFAGAQCTICGLLKGNTIPAHNYIPHSAGDEDYHWDACDGCEKFINKVGHNYGEWIDAVEPSCEIAGSLAHYHCECGLDFDADKNLMDDVSIPATGHSLGEWVVSKEPTCTEAGEERRDCDICDHYETKELPALGHDFSGGGSCALCGKLSDEAIAGIAIGSSVAVAGAVGFSILGVVLKKKRLKKANK